MTWEMFLAVKAPITLQVLLRQGIDRLAATGVAVDYRTIEAVVRREESVEQRGLVLNRTTISQILKGTYKKEPTDGTIRAIGWLAGVSDEAAFAAAGRRAPGPPFAAELPAGIDDLSPGERVAALALLRTLVGQRREINRYADRLAGQADGSLESIRKGRPGLVYGNEPEDPPAAVSGSS